MQDFLLTIIAISLVILTVELSIVFYYIIIFLREVLIITRRIKILEGSLEEKIQKLESEMALFGARAVKTLFKIFSKTSKK